MIGKSILYFRKPRKLSIRIRNETASVRCIRNREKGNRMMESNPMGIIEGLLGWYYYHCLLFCCGSIIKVFLNIFFLSLSVSFCLCLSKSSLDFSCLYFSWFCHLPLMRHSIFLVSLFLSPSLRLFSPSFPFFLFIYINPYFQSAFPSLPSSLLPSLRPLLASLLLSLPPVSDTVI